MKHLVGLLSAVFWSLSFVFTKQLLIYMTPIEVVFYRYLLAGIFYRFMLRNKTNNWTKEEKKTLIVSALLGITIYPIMACYSVSYISASFAGILNGTIPMLTILGERFFRGKSLTKRTIMALLISLIGIALLTGESETSKAPLLGAALMILSLVAWVIFTFINEKLFVRHTSLEILTYECLIGSIVMTPLVIFSKETLIRQINLFTNMSVVGNMIVLAFLVSGCGYLCYMYGLKHLGVAYMSFVMNLLPVFSVISAVILIHEPIYTKDVIALILISSSVVLMTKKKKTDLVYNQVP
ncbi:DMT family transporter [Acidaminobacter sp. JC074]|uniref:DMT family transporter n=1 Tax=Acidaminobacter sp. JC074 TaxID=2530199 RepID=UPI001F0E11DA|nr:DMT family transporter [Acidaminobacter sp. JC074]MCH4890812.1 DMT family transporter [Acidaminobacter sp. JC074]